MRVDPGVTWIVVAVVLVAIATIIAVSINRGKQARRLLAGVRGQINHPHTGERVPRALQCSGALHKDSSAVDMVFWLAVETDGLIWPKGPSILPDENGQWSATIRESGSPDSFAVSLWAVTPKGSQRIQNWLETGRRTDDFPGMSTLPEAWRIAQVSGLKLAE